MTGIRPEHDIVCGKGGCRARYLRAFKPKKKPQTPQEEPLPAK